MKVLLPYASDVNLTLCENLIEDNPDWKFDANITDVPYLQPQRKLKTTKLDNFDLIAPLQLDNNFEWFDKERIYDIANSVGVWTPVINPNTFPVIMKPRNGSGSLGVARADNAEELFNFLHREYDERYPFQQKRGERFAHPIYYDFGAGYQIEEFIDGQVVTIVGSKIRGEHRFGFAYDIFSNLDNYFVTSRAEYPSKHFKMDMFEKLTKVIDALGVDDVPYAFDVIVVRDSFTMIDLATRFAGNELTFRVCRSWYTGVLRALAGEELNFELPTAEATFQMRAGDGKLRHVKDGLVRGYDIWTQ